MTNKKPTEVITPPNILKAKMGGGMPAFDEAAIARAEAALQGMSGNFGAWLDDEVNKLEEAWRDAKAKGLQGAPGDALFRVVHDLKGLGATYDYPIVSRMAGSLARLLESDAARATAPASLIDAHLAAIRACVRDGVRSDDHPVGGALAGELEAKVGELDQAA